MIVFGIDTCCMSATAALLSDDRLIAQVVLNNNKTHSQKIMPLVEFMLKQADLKASDIDCFAAAVGPGSFTGVRIGVATAKALAYATDKPCVAVSTLKALSYNVPEFDGIICPILDARREQVYNALFKGRERLCDDRALSIDGLLDELIHTDDKIMFLGDGLPVFADKINERLKDRAVFASASQRMNLASSVAQIGYEEFLSGNTIDNSDLVPEYLRLSQAERERLEKEGKKSE